MRTLMGLHGISMIILQAVFDFENPKCVIDGLLAHQTAEQTKGDTSVFADDIMVSLLIDIVEAGYNHQTILTNNHSKNAQFL